MPDEIYLGLMSGTSLDAVDGVAVRFTPDFEILATASQPIPSVLRSSLLAITQPGDNEIDRLGELDNAVAAIFAEVALALKSSPGIDPDSIRAVGSHGQTIRHRPYAASPFSLQIGNPNLMAELCGLTVVADFRRRDVAAGGQGAPLVPAFHEALFRDRRINRVLLNLGGMANITVLPSDFAQPAYGFDTGPANVLMDAWCQRQLGAPYDKDGLWAQSGRIIPALLSELMEHAFFFRPPPKSTGREDFHPKWLDEILQTHPAYAPEDVQATLMELTAESAAAAIRGCGFEKGELWLCGGGAYNTALKGRLEAKLPGFSLHDTSERGLPPGWVEAAAFAWLARQTLLGLPGNLPAVTGAKGLRILGGIYLP